MYRITTAPQATVEHFPVATTLEFGNLPLIRVECNALFAESPVFDFDFLQGIRELVRDSFPVVADFQGGQFAGGLPFSLSVGPGPGAGFASEDGRLSFSLRNTHASVAWSRQTAEDRYPRFSVLRDLFANAVANVLPRWCGP